MRPIPQNLRDKMASQKFYKFCCLCGREGVQWHHALIFAGRQVNEEFCILPVCPDDHAIADRPDIKERLNWIMLNRATDEIISLYCKAIDYLGIKKKLNEKFGVWKMPVIK